VNPTSKYQSWMITAAVAAAALCYAWFLFLPGQAAIAEMRTDIQNKTDYLVTSQNLPPQIADTNRRLAEVKVYLAKSREQISNEGRLETVVRDITRAARDAGVRIAKLEPQAKIPLEKLVQMPVIIGVTGNFPQVHAWLGRVESLDAAIWVDGMRINTAGGNGGIVECEAKIIVFADRAENSR
jgi:Tfp pilus assembly protein PilO